MRRIAIATLPANEASLAALFESNVLNDADAQVQLAAVLALADLPPSRARPKLIAAKLAGDGARRDRWMADALTSAAAMHGVDFVQLAGSKFPAHDGRGAELPDAAVDAVAIVGEHLARGGLDGDAARRAARRAGRRGRRVSRRRLGVDLQLLARGPRGAVAGVGRRRAIARLLADIPFDSRSDCCGWPACGTPATPRSCKSSTATRCGRGSRTPS